MSDSESRDIDEIVQIRVREFLATMPSRVETPVLQIIDFISVGLITFSLIILQAFITSSSLPWEETTSLIAFSVAIPFLAANPFFTFVEKNLQKKGPARGRIGLGFIGFFADYVGVIFAIWHTSWIAALVFIATTLVAILCGVVFFVGFSTPTSLEQETLGGS